MGKDYEGLIICFIKLSGADILTMSVGNDNDASDITDWGFADDWGE